MNLELYCKSKCSNSSDSRTIGLLVFDIQTTEVKAEVDFNGNGTLKNSFTDMKTAWKAALGNRKQLISSSDFKQTG